MLVGAATGHIPKWVCNRSNILSTLIMDDCSSEGKNGIVYGLFGWCWPMNRRLWGWSKPEKPLKKFK